MRVSLSRGLLIENDYGLLKADWKKDLAEEENKDYLPSGYSYDKVVELQVIRASKQSSGYGSKLMEEFLKRLKSHPYNKAELVFLDPSPDMLESNVEDRITIERLKKFYSKFGFRSHPQADRMWLVLEGHISDTLLPK